MMEIEFTPENEIARKTSIEMAAQLLCINDFDYDTCNHKEITDRLLAEYGCTLDQFMGLIAFFYLHMDLGIHQETGHITMGFISTNLAQKTLQIHLGKEIDDHFVKVALLKILEVYKKEGYFDGSFIFQDQKYLFEVLPEPQAESSVLKRWKKEYPHFFEKGGDYGRK